MEPNDRRKQNKKLAGVVALFLLLCVIFTLLVLSIGREKEPDPDDDTIETDSSAVDENYTNTELYAYNNHPISLLLPIIDDEGNYCLSYDISGVEDKEYVFRLTIDYKTEEGKRAAEALLESPDFSTYNPSQYEIIYTKISD